ncbi:MAG: hypothetical protein WC615_00370 [Mucilaginibacter sp.]|jgi:hypothetical protein|uniref:hypothetical protein n=1 Tax=Mucilaginibacter sp. TaxID=1882438 RepID=UPI00356359B3
MLHQISWFTYGSAIFLIAIVYYAYVGLTFYKTELHGIIYRLTGRKPAVSKFSDGDFQIPGYSVAGAIKPEEVDFVAQEDLSFGPPDETETPVIPTPVKNEQDIHLLGEFSEMLSEVKTLIRVINESSETKENFEMLFRLIIQKYYSLAGTAYEEQVNDYLIIEGADQFPFSLTLIELQSLWTNEAHENQPA